MQRSKIICLAIRLSLPVGRVVRDVYYSATVSTIAGPYALSHDLARKNAKFTVKLSATCYAVLGRCGESRRSNTLTVTVRFFELS